MVLFLSKLRVGYAYSTMNGIDLKTKNVIVNHEVH